MIEIKQVLATRHNPLEAGRYSDTMLGAIIVSRLILKRLLWTVIIKAKTTADDRILPLLENLQMLYTILRVRRP